MIINVEGILGRHSGGGVVSQAPNQRRNIQHLAFEVWRDEVFDARNLKALEDKFQGPAQSAETRAFRIEAGPSRQRSEH
jgi:hypothetical protein